MDFEEEGKMYMGAAVKRAEPIQMEECTKLASACTALKAGRHISKNQAPMRMGTGQLSLCEVVYLEL